MEGYPDGEANGQIALIKNGELIYKKEIARPLKCSVSNNGFVVCCDATLVNVPSGVFYAFDENGNLILSLPIEANIDNCKISNNSKYAIFTSAGSYSDDGNKLFIVDLEKKEIVNKFDPPLWYDNARINEKSKSLILSDYNKQKIKIDFNGKIITK